MTTSPDLQGAPWADGTTVSRIPLNVSYGPADVSQWTRSAVASGPGTAYLTAVPSIQEEP
jgi:hypothetical protein